MKSVVNLVTEEVRDFQTQGEFFSNLCCSCLTSVVVVVKILVLGQPCLESKDLSVLGQDLSVLGSVGCSQLLELPLDIVRDRNKVLLLKNTMLLENLLRCWSDPWA